LVEDSETNSQKVCGERFRTDDLREAHINRRHLQIKPYECTYPVENGVGDPGTGPASKDSGITICGKRFFGKRALDLHEEQHNASATQKFVCKHVQKCATQGGGIGNSSGFNGNLKRGQKSNGNRDQKCGTNGNRDQKCGTNSNGKSSPGRNRVAGNQAGIESLIFRDEVCRQVFNERQKLVRHELVHKHKPFVCDWKGPGGCGERVSVLNAERRGGGRNYRYFATLEDLTDHIKRVHLKENTYSIMVEIREAHQKSAFEGKHVITLLWS
jgi:hypothetical protein